MNGADYSNLVARITTIERHLYRMVQALERLSPVPPVALGPTTKPAGVDALSRVTPKDRAKWDAEDQQQPF